ncbi:hypothetical protein I8752_13510 [Nostocaceae cyanobacterium CENA369]|uniref:Uncharacterized protein n=1 Tax=Dendronalium phyllosphericum CENA369 TaxID=1725256 RepID=A0A8J7I9F7_9NOST|nr:hypothetical protein [Dendronalium phyllosphericum]MBH8574022.1 hypothetical protein [Dendronalium phyllosphericum CENA369]
MTKMLVPNLHTTNLELLLQNLTPAQANSIHGGSSSIYLTNISDGVNNTENTSQGSDAFNYNNNKINTVDYSRSNYNWFYFFD